MVFIPLLQINEDFTMFVEKMKTFIEKSKDVKLLKKFYELILCLAFYTEEGNGQKCIINEMFKHLTMKNIVS